MKFPQNMMVSSFLWVHDLMLPGHLFKMNVKLLRHWSLWICFHCIGFGTVFTSLEESGKVLYKSVTKATVQTVNHKWVKVLYLHIKYDISTLLALVFLQHCYYRNNILALISVFVISLPNVEISNLFSKILCCLFLGIEYYWYQECYLKHTRINTV